VALTTNFDFLVLSILDMFMSLSFALHGRTISPPDYLLPWLHTDGSLTAMIEALSGQPLRVERRFEGYCALTFAEKQQLCPQGTWHQSQLAWVRETYLYGDADTPWVAAKSIFPLNSLQGEARRLQHLKGVPIGYVLFKNNRALPNQRCLCLSASGWQRQTCYDWYGRKLLISETFLDAFMKRVRPQSD